MILIYQVPALLGVTIQQGASSAEEADGNQDPATDDARLGDCSGAPADAKLRGFAQQRPKGFI